MMKYLSTRDRTLRITGAEAVKLGLSKDGGLLTPESIPQIDGDFLTTLSKLSYQERTAKVMALYLTDYTEDELLGFAGNAYGPDKYDTPAVAPPPALKQKTLLPARPWPPGKTLLGPQVCPQDARGGPQVKPPEKVDPFPAGSAPASAGAPVWRGRFL